MDKQTKAVISSKKKRTKPKQKNQDEFSKTTGFENLAPTISPARTSLRNTAQIPLSPIISLETEAMTGLGP